jgi:hypothetical protein
VLSPDTKHGHGQERDDLREASLIVDALTYTPNEVYMPRYLFVEMPESAD